MDDQTQAQEPTALLPKPIVALDESVINRIAAGEIIVRPANAVKELLENCIDAGATIVKINIKEGGIKMLQIQDNGCGIRKSDLGILCERFTTSKIRKFDDLVSLRTYGFRGEALASVSHVARLNVATKTRTDTVGWKAQYLDGKLVPLRHGGPPEPQPCAGNDGTVITVEDMFYNVPQRRKALQTASDEYRKILDVVTKYAVHNQGVAIFCKKVGSSSPDVNTSVNSTTLETIGKLYTENLKKELMQLEFIDTKLDYRVRGYFSSPDYHAKKSTVLIFINNRLVDCSPLRKSLELTYNAILPKGCFPFIYISLEIATEKVDPNVHPNKKEVHFLNEDEIIEGICAKLDVLLKGTELSRSYYVQTLLPVAPSKPKANDQPVGSQASSAPTLKVKSIKAAPQKMVRTDHQSRTLPSLLRPSTSQMVIDDEITPSGSRSPKNDDLEDLGESSQSPMNKVPLSSVRIEESRCALKTVQDLRKEILASTDSDLRELIKRHTFVGVAHLQKGLSCVQFETQLHLVRHSLLCEELFYQLGVKQFGAFDRIKLDPPPALDKLINLAVESEPSDYLDQFGRSKAVEKICNLLNSKGEMLNEYFSLKINSDGNLESVPILLPQYIPNLEKLPLFLMRIAILCDWKTEIGCFKSFLRELAFFYVPGGIKKANEREEHYEDRIEEQLKDILFPAMRIYLQPPNQIRESIRFVTSLPDLYKVFERC